ncbi:hypothetical protein MWU58_09575 [Flavobacteriaceae bacterium S0825]|uniref:hypothetical protein n=1 Tax=Gaetbulibacter sp. S0825 TaxID=2720084 RepID=UPI00142F457A|nr:hypothetical protein [Gaetbulibacter sp. S0825]MCK0109543.1 hypothetical protein [Flavobacteriaceae bacterium S0825]NIX65176.1 hypothetical protein [Gaetbulibacter sp. S0825]
MGVIVRIETRTENVLEWHEEFSYEQEEYHQKVIDSFEYRLNKYLTYSINGFIQINAKFDFNPITKKFKLKECNSPFRHHIDKALKTELKIYS